MRDLLRSAWREPRAPGAPPPTWRDRALVGVLVPLAVVEGVLRPELPARGLWVPVAVGLLITLYWRRTHPLVVAVIGFLATATATLLSGGEQPGLVTLAAMLLLPYALFRWGSGREAVLGAAALLAGLVVATATADRLPDAVGGATALTTGLALGLALRFRAGARARELDQVKLLERERLARDLHDTVAHHVSAMAIRAQAGIATADSRPEAAVDALRLIESEAARTLAEMRAIVRALRPARPPDLVPTPGLADVAELARPGRDGPAVEVEISGEVDGLAPAVGAALYRLAQESVTNAVRHARSATRVLVDVRADDTAVHLRVSDDGDVAHPRPEAAAGYGIPGMVERADLLGGTCEAGPNPDRGWTVSAVLPRGGAIA
ncbi:sensor histidine kinase [Pseudonocardia humida]|uniref:histidine kinase n=1 Tax=Pseudonocardia humida TaxID=2800819 RepID=A0ABT1A8Q2_9PSEU|nr:histidine kinase [Pseudonocardia humida]MCO1659315.1 sensor histidine kinase [Pseudonocardia humida]